MASKTNYNPGQAPLGVLELGATFLTELAQAAQQLQNDNLGSFLPDKPIPTKRVEVQVKDGNLRLTGIVNPGMPNGLNKWDTYRSFSYEPALFRRGSFVDMETVNYLSAHDPGAKAYGMDLIQSQVQDLTNQANMMNAVMRAQLLLGGIDITDVETKVQVQANAGIPVGNAITVGVTAGFGSDLKWDDVDADIIDFLIRARNRAKLLALAEPDTLIMNGNVQQLLLRNKKIREILGYQGAGARDTFGFVKVQDGKVVELVGMKIVTCDTLYDEDQADGTIRRRFVIPNNKVVMLTTKHPMPPGATLGYTVLAKGEHPTGGMGIWMRSWDQHAMGGPQSAPGVGIQLGMSSLPVLYYPKWVHNITIADNGAIEAIVGNAYAV